MGVPTNADFWQLSSCSQKGLLHGRYIREGSQQTLPEMWKQDKAGQYIEQETETLQFMDEA